MPRSNQLQTRPTPPPPAVQRSGFGDLVKQGVALGAGQAIAHTAIGSLVRMLSSPASAPVASCSEYQRCLTKVDKHTCDTLFEQCARP